MAQDTHSTGPMTSAPLNVERKVMYTRPQKGHSITKHLLFGWALAYIPTIYYVASPNHYFHT
jgi:hypothetical protein